MNAMVHACVYIPRGRSSYMWTDIRPHRPRPHFEFPSFSLNHLRPLFHLLSRSEEDDDEQKEECGRVRRVRDVDEMVFHGSSRVLVHWPTRAAQFHILTSYSSSPATLRMCVLESHKGFILLASIIPGKSRSVHTRPQMTKRLGRVHITRKVACVGGW